MGIDRRGAAIVTGAHAREISKIACEVRLIRITERHGKIGERHLGRTV